MVPIFAEHWGDNLLFYLNFALFSRLGGMNLDHDFVQVWKKRSSSKIEHIFPPNSGEEKKKRSSVRMAHLLFSPHLRSNVHLFKLLGGMQMWTILKLLGGYSQIFGGLYLPISPPLASAPLGVIKVMEILSH